MMLPFCVIFVFAAAAARCVADAASLIQPEVIDGDNNNDVSLDIAWTEIDPGFGGSPFQTRALGGSVPGPTIVVSPGSTLHVTFRNQLTVQPTAKASSDPANFNRFSDPDTANLHFHGAHATSVLPGDDTTLAIPPGDSYNYTLPILAEHAPGLHWIHPHHHGSTTLHLGGGAACAFIVKDPPGSLPALIQDAPEKILVFQDFHVPELSRVAKMAGDEKFLQNMALIEGGEDVGRRFVTVNGQFQPTMTVQVGRWYRWRILFAGWQDLSLALQEDKPQEGTEKRCELQLLAKDGIYIQDFPRAISEVPLPPGGRADVMVRCNRVGTSQFQAMSRDTLTVEVTLGDPDAGPTEVTLLQVGEPDNTTSSTTNDLSSLDWTPIFSEYLQDLRTTDPSPGCSCHTELEGYDGESTINRKRYIPGNSFLHTSYLGAVVERELTDIKEHSYHQHVYPFQLIEIEETATGYFRIGDWHDTFLEPSLKKEPTIVVRYRTTVLPGKLMVHCHNSLHADRGMMAKEYVRDVTAGESGAECQCAIQAPIEGVGIVDMLDTSHGGGQSSTSTSRSWTPAWSAGLWLSMVVASSW